MGVMVAVALKVNGGLAIALVDGWGIYMDYGPRVAHQGFYLRKASFFIIGRQPGFAEWRAKYRPRLQVLGHIRRCKLGVERVICGQWRCGEGFLAEVGVDLAFVFRI